ncbi:hypothetical protein [Desulfotomaculum defluvii]
MEEDWSPCPRCGSNKVQKVYKWAIVFALFCTAGCMFWIGLLFPPLLLGIPVAIILGFIMMFGKNLWQCQDCKKTWVAKSKPFTVGDLIKYLAIALVIMVLAYSCGSN